MLTEIGNEIKTESGHIAIILSTSTEYTDSLVSLNAWKWRYPNAFIIERPYLKARYVIARLKSES